MKMAYATCCLDAPFDVIVNFEAINVTSITINKSEITQQFTLLETRQKLLADNKNILVGTFIVTVISGSLEKFDVKAFTSQQYLYNFTQFLALTDNSDQENCKLVIFSNKNSSGTEETFQLYNNAVVIDHPLGSIQVEWNVTITVYILPGQIEDLIGSTCYMPMFFQVVGL